MIRTTLQNQERNIERRKAKLGLAGRDYVMPNSGQRRTREKRELLRRMDEDRRRRGIVSGFAAAY